MAKSIREGQSSMRGFAAPRSWVAVACGLVLAMSAPALAQSGAVKSGIRGRVVIDKELQQATTRPIDPKEPWYKTHANVRRPSGHGRMPALTEPAPRLEVVLEGADGKDKEVRVLTVSGLRFSPASLLVPKPARFKVINEQKFAITIVAGTNETPIGSGKFAFIDLDGGLHSVRIKELPAAQAKVRVLEKAIVLPLEAGGLIPRVAVEGGMYKLGFYDGAEPLTVQEIGIPDTKVVAVDASISANRVVTVDVKDGGLTVVKTPTKPGGQTKPAPPGADETDDAATEDVPDEGDTE